MSRVEGVRRKLKGSHRSIADWLGSLWSFLLGLAGRGVNFRLCLTLVWFVLVVFVWLERIK